MNNLWPADYGLNNPGVKDSFALLEVQRWPTQTHNPNNFVTITQG